MAARDQTPFKDLPTFQGAVKCQTIPCPVKEIQIRGNHLADPFSVAFKVQLSLK